jgi:hypothetical protein
MNSKKIGNPFLVYNLIIGFSYLFLISCNNTKEPLASTGPVFKKISHNKAELRLQTRLMKITARIILIGLLMYTMERE